MSEVPKSSDAAQTSGDTTNPFAPIDYTSRLKAPVRHTGTFHAMQPLQPGQLYGTAHWMTPPKPLPSFPASQESGAPSAEQNPPVFSAPLPSYMNSSPVDPAPQSAPAASDLPPYLQRRPPIGRATVQAQPSEEAKVALYSAADVQEPSPASGAQPEAQAPAAQARASTHPRRSRVARHQLEAAQTQANDESIAAPFAAPLPPLPEMSSGFSRTSLCESAEPTVVTIPSPILARTVASPAPPTSLSKSARTVTLAFTKSSIPSFATAETFGVSITLGLTLIFTASRTFRPARSIAAAFSNFSSIPALSDAINALTTLSTFPPAR